MSKYLDQLEFKAENFGDILTGYVSNMRVVALVLIALLFAGVTSFITLPRTLSPEINITIVTVSTALPGATPQDVESLITIPLEDEVESVDDIDVMTSTSREGVSTIVVQFRDGTNQNVALTDVQNAVDTASALPADATDPTVSLVDFEDEPILRYAVVANADAASLNRFTTDVKKRIEDLDLIDRVRVAGDEVQEVQIVIDQKKAAALNITLDSISSAVRAVTHAAPAGTLHSDTSAFGLTIDRGAVSVADLRDVQVSVGGQRYALGEIATVQEAPEPGQVAALITTPDGTERKAVTLSIYRIIGSKISDATAAVDAVTEEAFNGENANRFSLVEIFNVDRDIDEQFNDLVRNLSLTILLVFLTLLVFVGIRQAIVAAISIPLVFMAAFIAMQVAGISLNFLSFFSLLLSLGLLVDVTIVIVSAMTSYYRSGKFTPLQTGLLVWKDFLITLSVTTLTTVWAFVPLLLASGIIGEYIKPIPVIVSSMLAASVAIGFLVILPLMVWLLDFRVAQRVKIFFGLICVVVVTLLVRGVVRSFGIVIPGFFWILLAPLAVFLFVAGFMIVKNGLRVLGAWIHTHMRMTEKVSSDCLQNGLINLDPAKALYRRALVAIIAGQGRRRQTVAIVVVFFIFSFALVPLGFVKNEFFPSEDSDTLYVNVELPLGVKETYTLARAQEFIPGLLLTPELERIQTEVGVNLGEEGQPSPGAGSHHILYTLQLTDTETRDRTAIEIAQVLRRSDAVMNYEYGTVRVAELSGGPPAGADVTLKISGDDLTILDQKAQEVMAYVRGIEGTSNIAKSITPGTAKIVFVPRDAQLEQHGLTTSDVGVYLRAFGSGATIDEDVVFSDTSDKRDIKLRTSVSVEEASALGQVSVATPRGERVPLSSLGSFELAPNPTKITREDGDRTISVTAGVVEGFNAGEINADVGTFADGELNLPSGYRWETGGANEENNDSVASILQAMVLAFVLIFLTLIVQLNSYRKSFIVLLVIPLAISGVFLVFALIGLPLSFPSLIGLLALFGIVINNSIIIIDQINRNLKEGLLFEESVVDGAVSRLEPILLSSLTTIIGLLPITLSEPVWLGLGSAIIAGLMFSGIIMLFFIPTVYHMMFAKEYEEIESHNKV